MFLQDSECHLLQVASGPERC